MSVAEGYSISVLCDGTHRPGREQRAEVYGYTKQKAHAELRRLGWRLGPEFTAYCPACKPPRTRGVTGMTGAQLRELAAQHGCHPDNGLALIKTVLGTRGVEVPRG